jgi:hypothetical protein
MKFRLHYSAALDHSLKCVEFEGTLGHALKRAAFKRKQTKLPICLELLTLQSDGETWDWDEINPEIEWFGFDLDGTLAETNGTFAPDKIGKPIWPMVHKLIDLLQAGEEVKIFTARLNRLESVRDGWDHDTVEHAINKWCKKHIGRELPITNVKDKDMICLYDDRAISVQKNTGKVKDANA